MKPSPKKILFFLFFLLFNVAYGFLCSQAIGSTQCLMNCKSCPTDHASDKTSQKSCCFYESGQASSFVKSQIMEDAKCIPLTLDVAYSSTAAIKEYPLLPSVIQENQIHSPPIYILKQVFRI